MRQFHRKFAVAAFICSAVGNLRNRSGEAFSRQQLKELTSHSSDRNVRVVMQKVTVYIRGWLGYFGIASMKTTMQPGIPEWQARAGSNCRKAYWHMAKNGHVQRELSKERLAQAGYDSILDRYESVHLCD